MPYVSRYVQTLNKAQQRALFRVWERGEVLDGEVPTQRLIRRQGTQRVQTATFMTYRAFRKTVQFSFDCAMVPWAGMWLGIERDGYTHS